MAHGIPGTQKISFCAYPVFNTGTRLHVPVTFDGGAQSADRRKYGRALCMSTQSAESAFARFFGPTAIARVMQAANNVPPVYYFIYLLAAGVGEFELIPL